MRGLRAVRWSGVLLFGLVTVQVLCAAFFIYETFGPLLGLRSAPLSWAVHEMIEIGAALGLLIGTGFGSYAIMRLDLRRREAEGKLAALSAAFNEMLADRFAEWQLTPAERDVAHFVIKGFSTREIADFRQTSEGTVKAQTAAIYRKAGVKGRVQLLSLFLDDLMNDGLDALPGGADQSTAKA